MFVRCLLGLLVVTGLTPLGAAEPVPTDPLFSRHVVPIFSRLGCNAGGCHGAVKGQNGFRLSLFGAEPTSDHARLLREANGRRLNRLTFDDSLLLLKGSGTVPHEGGNRMPVGSREYQIVRNWIASGAKLDNLDASRVTRLSVEPGIQTAKVTERYRLQVSAAFADGSNEDVTALCSFEVVSKELARVDLSGEVQAIGVGDTAIIARFRGEPVVAMLVVPRAGTEPFPDVKPVNFIDGHVLAKLQRLNIHPALPCDDATFLRRVSLDVTGSLPLPSEARAFLADATTDKRSKKIEELLARPGHIALWTTKLCDILRPAGFDGKHGLTEAAEARRFYEWIRSRLAENTPYDQLAERVLLATSLEGRPSQEWIKEVRSLLEENVALRPDLKAYSSRRTLDLYWQRNNATGVKGAMQVAHAFLGLRLECAQCHRHPHDVWQQDDLLSFANFFMRVSNPTAGGSSTTIAKEGEMLAKEAKELRDQAKKVGEKTKDKSLSKDDVAKVNAEVKSLNDKATALDAASRRIKGTEIHVGGKPTFAGVTSTLGKQESKQFRLLGAKQPVSVGTEQDPRELVVAWLRQSDNPFFAQAMVNRVWAHYFGRGIIDPPDHLSPLNPPSHPELLDALSKGFIENKYDLRWLHRTILASRTYQQTAQTNITNRADTTNYASAYLRRLSAEVLVDAVNHATGGTETYPPELFLPPGAKAIEVAGGTGSDRTRASLQYPFSIFGRPMRNPDVQCDCERDGKPTIVQTLYLANHPAIHHKISDAKGRVTQVLKIITDDDKRIEELFLWSLSRLPLADERQICLKYIKDGPTPQRAYEDVLWSLLNTREFLFNH
ncbi:MAG: DUF1553 domain-containing protein [Gemmataceae bacterium]|nr:DUF1553 domain-containing protein [Gemmataceae bacterium]